MTFVMLQLSVVNDCFHEVDCFKILSFLIWYSKIRTRLHDQRRLIAELI